MEIYFRDKVSLALCRDNGGAPLKRIFVFATCALALITTDCTRAIGPRYMVRDRSLYSESLSDSWKDQTLLNIVKVRYVDPPTFVDVSSIIASYSLSQTANVAGNITTGGGNPSNFTGGGVAMGGSGTFSNSPTITYTPLTGTKFIKSLMTPLVPEVVFASIQSGFPADVILLATVTSINGLKNQEFTGTGITPADPEFHQVRALLRKIQISGAVKMYIKVEPDKKETEILTFRSKDIPPETLADIHEVRRLLHLNPDATDFKLVFGAAPNADDEIAVLTRSVLSIIKTMAAEVEVPPDDLAQHYAFPGFELGKDDPSKVRLIRIHSGKERPANSFVTINYRDTWFWIDDGDLQSKQMFSLMMFFITMAQAAPQENPLPVVTIPAR